MITSMNHVTIAVKDINISFAFYRDVLGLQALVKWDNGAYFLVGDEKNYYFWFCLNIDEKCCPTKDYTHYAFSVNQENFELMSAKIINSGAQIFKDNTSFGDSLYFCDPDGHKLEIHVGNWRTRIDLKKANPGHWKNIEWFV